jgi:hypothetical protein
VAAWASGQTPPAAVPAVSGWDAIPSRHAIVYAVPGTVSRETLEATADRLDRLIAAIVRDSGLSLPGRLVYPLYPTLEAFRREWWQFATLRDGVLHGWGTVLARGRSEISTYQVARLIARQGIGPAVPLVTWGLGDLLGDRQAGVDSHAHARLLLDRPGLPAVTGIIHQVDFSQALPGAHVQSVSFLAFLVEQHGMTAVVEFARTGGRRWYDFAPLFERTFGMSLAEADHRWRGRIERISAPPLAEQEVAAYQRAAAFAYGVTLAPEPGGLVSRPGGAAAYLEGLRTHEALRRFDLTAATAAMQRGRQGLDAAQRSLVRRRLLARAAVVGLAVVPIALALLVLVGPWLRSLWSERCARRRTTGRKTLSRRL